MSFTVPIRKPSEANDAAPGQRDLQEQIGSAFGRLLTVASTQSLPAAGIRNFALGDPKTELLSLLAGADNVIPHGLNRAVKEVFLTPVGPTAVSVAISLKDPATLSTPLEATKVVCLRVSANVTGRVRVL
jgi:hypothetical protein